MKAHCFAAATAIAVLALAPAAHAQAVCDDIARVLHEAEDNFGGAIGDEIEEDFYGTTFMLPGADVCRIAFDLDSMFYCTWQFPSEAAMVNFLDSQIAEMRACLTIDWKEETIEGDGEDAEWRLISGKSFGVTINGEDLVYVAHADASKASPTVCEAVVSLTYIWF